MAALGSEIAEPERDQGLARIPTFENDVKSRRISIRSIGQQDNMHSLATFSDAALMTNKYVEPHNPPAKL